MSGLASAVYTGLVTHERTRPRRHRLAYRVFALLLDLDELPRLHARARLFSAERFNLVSFHARDHADGSAQPLRPRIAALLSSAGIRADGPIRLLCYPRICGTQFNPLSTYFCHDAGGGLTAILYEVNNTFGQRHSYLIPVAQPAARPIRQRCAKEFFVSPFMDMAMTYDFVVRPPADDVSLTVRGSDGDGTLIVANFTGERREFSDAALLAAIARCPLLTLTVVGGIHWEAAKLFAKGMRLRQRPPPPPAPITIVGAEGADGSPSAARLHG